LFLLCGELLLAQSATEEWTSEKYPPYIRRVTYFGERPDWSLDGKKLLFVEKSYGDVFEVELATGIIRPVTHHYFHNGYTRALYLSNGDILLSGSKTFNPAEPTDSRFRTPELWVLSKNLDKPPTPLGEFCWEGPAVSRKQLKIAWAEKHGTYPNDRHLYQMWVADIDYSPGTPRIKNQKMVLDNRAYGEGVLEAQNFRPPDEKELIWQYSHYRSSQSGRDVIDVEEVMGVDLETGKVTNYSNSPDTYNEPEGIFPDGKSLLVEDSRQHPVRAGIDLWRLYLDGSNRWERMTWFNEARKYQATNPVVSDDGRYFAFTVPAVGDTAGVGHGIYIYDLQAAAQARR